MKSRYLVQSVAFVLITKIENNEEYVLLQRRCNTGMLDGEYDVACSGHLEKGETLKIAAIREAKEELGIDILEENLDLISAINAKYGDIQYVSMAFHVTKYQAIPHIVEKDKCNQLKWVPINNLPSNLAVHTKKIIDSYINKELYIEIGF